MKKKCDCESNEICSFCTPHKLIWSREELERAKEKGRKLFEKLNKHIKNCDDNNKIT